jgi:hypothetical protein
MSEDETAAPTGTALMGHLDPVFLERPNGIDRRTLLTTLALLPALSAPPLSVSASAETTSSGPLPTSSAIAITPASIRPGSVRSSGRLSPIQRIFDRGLVGPTTRLDLAPVRSTSRLTRRNGGEGSRGSDGAGPSQFRCEGRASCAPSPVQRHEILPPLGSL